MLTNRWSFWQIDRDHCTPNPCRNGGQCLNTPDDYYCQCSGNGWSWHGKNCTVPFDSAGVGGAVKTVGPAITSATTTTTTTTTTTKTTPPPLTTPTPTQTTPTTSMTATPTTASIRPKMTPQPLQERPTTVVRRPGTVGSNTAVWRQQQRHNDENDSSKSECRKV